MWTKIGSFLGKQVLGYIFEAVDAYIQYKIAEAKLKKKVKGQVNDIKKTSANKREAANRIRDMLNN